LNRAVTYNLRFPGQVFDGQAGLHQNGFRDYDPAVGKYVESDPLGVTISSGTYSYVDSDPLAYADPFGLAKCTYSISIHIMTCASNDGSRKTVVGPVPPGNYKMNRDSRPQHAGRNFWRLEPVPKIPGWKCGLPFFGARCGFEFHPGTVSEGCITALKTDSEVMKQYAENNALLLSEDGSNTLTVVP
jgi:RHS repeat-associated protein